MTQIRTAAPADVDAVARLDAELFGSDAWSEAVLRAELLGQSRESLVAVQQSQVVGYAVAMVTGDTADLTRIGVARAVRRQGIGTGLLLTCRERLVGAGVGRLLLEVSETNEEALAFYRREGFAEVARRPGYYRGGTAAVVMARELGPPGPT